MLKYLIPFITSFLLSIFFICLAFLFFKKNISEGRDSFRHIHKNIFRWGGLAIIFSFNLAILLNRDLYISFELWGIMVASLLILVVGIWDDIRELSWKIQLLFQSLIAGLVFLFGIRIQYLVNPFAGQMIQLDSGWLIGISFLAGLIWILLLMNAMNWLDGIDGLSGGVTLIAAATIFFLSLKAEVNQPPMAIIAMILGGSILGFLIFNFNPGKIMAGTAGSMFMGFALAALAIFSGTKIATTLLVLFIPIVDLLWVVWERWKKGKSIFIPDKNHLHHKLLELGWSQRRIALSFYATTGLIAVVALNTRALGKSITLILFAVLMLLFLITISKVISGQKITPEKNKIWKKILLIGLGLLILVSISFFVYKRHTILYSKPGNEITEIKLGQEIFLVETVKSPEEKEKGLSGRESLCQRCAMLFLFDDSAVRKFWMKDMHFDLDILWLNKGEIIKISPNISHQKGGKESISSAEEVDGIIEINSGMSEKLGLKVGDKIQN